MMAKPYSPSGLSDGRSKSRANWAMMHGTSRYAFTPTHVAPPVPEYVPVDPRGQPTGKTIFAPYIFGARTDLWTTLLGGSVDEMTSAPQTLNLLSTLVAFTSPQVLVEVGTYRGWGTACLAETLHLYGLPGHLWSCDPVDHGVSQMLRQAELFDRVTLIQGTFEDLLAQLHAPIDFCYIDGASRLPYTRLALPHMATGGLIAVDDCAGAWRGAKTLRKMANLYLPTHRGLVLLAT